MKPLNEPHARRWETKPGFDWPIAIYAGSLLTAAAILWAAWCKGI